MTFDIESLSLQETTQVLLKHPGTGEQLYEDEQKEKPLFIAIYGTGSKKHRDASHVIAGKYAMREKQKKTITSSEAEEEYAEFLASISYNSNFSFGGSIVADKEAFKKLYLSAKLGWIVPQVQAALQESGNFFSK